MAEAGSIFGVMLAAFGAVVLVAGLHSRLVGRRWIGFILSRSQYATDEDRAGFDEWARATSRKLSRIGRWLVVAGVTVLVLSSALGWLAD